MIPRRCFTSANPPVYARENFRPPPPAAVALAVEEGDLSHTKNVTDSASEVLTLSPLPPAPRQKPLINPGGPHPPFPPPVPPHCLRRKPATCAEGGRVETGRASERGRRISRGISLATASFEIARLARESHARFVSARLPARQLGVCCTSALNRWARSAFSSRARR